MPYTESQQEGINHDGHLMITACPGSGKTRVITERAVRLLNNLSNKIALVTFTRAAAEEMRHRTDKMSRSNRKEIKTFHSFLCQQYTQLKTNLRIASFVQIKNILYRTLNKSHIALDYSDLQVLVETHGSNLYPDDLKNSNPDEWSVYKIYCELLAEHGVIDLHGICRDVVLGIREGSISPLAVTHLLIDEFQDVDNIQLAWIDEHVKRGVQVTVVADDDQSIYAFRRSLGYEGLQRFIKLTNPKLVVLDTCFRCPSQILDPASLLIDNNSNRIPKVLTSFKGGTGQILHVACTSTVEQANAVSTVLGANKGTRAVLSRKNVDLDLIESALKVEGHNCIRLSGRPFWEIESCSLLVSFIHSLNQPSSHLGLQSILSYLNVDEDVISSYSTKVSNQSGAIDDTDLFEYSLTTIDTINKVFSRFGQQQTTDWKKAVQDATAAIILLYKGFDERYTFNRRSALTQSACDAICQYKGSLSDVLINIQSPLKKKRDIEDDGTIVLGSFHSSKGLEFDNVWIVNADEFKEDDLETSELEEERRLFYVAMTRSITNLYISTTNKPSLFLYETGLLSNQSNPQKIR